MPWWRTSRRSGDGQEAGRGSGLGKARALSTRGIKAVWLRLTKRAGLIPRRGGVRGTQYGYGSHEMRDLAKSLLHTYAKKDGFDMDCCDFWLGHTIDKLGYDKFYQDKEYVKKQYLIAEKYLNIISIPQASEQVKHQEEEIETLKQQMAEIRQAFTATIQRLNQQDKAHVRPIPTERE